MRMINISEVNSVVLVKVLVVKMSTSYLGHQQKAEKTKSQTVQQLLQSLSLRASKDRRDMVGDSRGHCGDHSDGTDSGGLFCPVTGDKV